MANYTTPFKADDILSSQYTAPNGMRLAVYYRVIKVFKNYVTVAQLGSSDVYSNSRMGVTTPKDNVKGPELTVRYNGFGTVRLNQMEVAVLWNGEPLPFTI